jgi:hypothetical protein
MAGLLVCACERMAVEKLRVGVGRGASEEGAYGERARHKMCVCSRSVD